jgi:hypothetical protein
VLLYYERIKREIVLSVLTVCSVLNCSDLILLVEQVVEYNYLSVFFFVEEVEEEKRGERYK